MNQSTKQILKGLTELGSLDITDFSLNFAISQAASKLTLVERAYLKSVSALIKKHIEVSENGVPLTQGDGPYISYVYKSVKDKEDYLAEMDKLNNAVVDFNIKIKATQLKEVKGLKGFTMMKLGVLIENDLEVLA